MFVKRPENQPKIELFWNKDNHTATLSICLSALKVMTYLLSSSGKTGQRTLVVDSSL